MSIAEKITAIAENEKKVYDKGRTDEWSDFWDELQQNGTRTDYSYSFYMMNGRSGWSDINFKPKYSMYPTSMNRFFTRSRVTDFKKILNDRGLILDTSNCTNFNMAFSQSNVSRVGILNLENCIDFTDAFAWANYIESIDLIVLSEKATTRWGSPFVGCYFLKEIRFGGVIPQSIGFASSPLTVESMKSVITHLKNYAGTSNAGAHTLTLSDTSKTAMANLGAIAEFGGRTYDAYLTDIGWNLA